MSAKKLAVPAYPQYVLITLCALLLFVFVRQLTNVLLTPLFVAVLAVLPILIVPRPGRVQSLVQNLEVLANKPPLEKDIPQVAEPEESLATGEEASIRYSVARKR